MVSTAVKEVKAEYKLRHPVKSAFGFESERAFEAAVTSIPQKV
jgi:hypothetical protein